MKLTPRHDRKVGRIYFAYSSQFKHCYYYKMAWEDPTPIETVWYELNHTEYLAYVMEEL